MEFVTFNDPDANGSSKTVAFDDFSVLGAVHNVNSGCGLLKAVVYMPTGFTLYLATCAHEESDTSVLSKWVKLKRDLFK